MDALWQALNSWTALRLVRTANYAFLAYALCQSAYFQTVVWRTRSLHPNLRFFLVCMSLEFGLCSGFRRSDSGWGSSGDPIDFTGCGAPDLLLICYCRLLL